MKKLLIFIFLITIGVSYSQETPVTLIGKVKYLHGDKYELTIEAEIDPDWCMYSQDLPDGGPYPTRISFPKSKSFELVGKSVETSSHKKVVNDDIFNLKLTKYYEDVLFRQVIRIKNKNLRTIKADIDYMSCNSDTCLPPMQEKVEFRL